MALAGIEIEEAQEHPRAAVDLLVHAHRRHTAGVVDPVGRVGRPVGVGGITVTGITVTGITVTVY